MAHPVYVNVFVVTELDVSLPTDKSASYKQSLTVQANVRQPFSPASCGKICSYDYDFLEKGKYYPLLHKHVNCPNTFYRMAHSPYPVIQPPPRKPPTSLLKNFTIDGQCPITLFWYLDHRSSVRNSNRQHFDAEKFRKLLELDYKTNINVYHDNNVLKSALLKYKHIIQGKRVAVIGTQTPWAEAMLVNLGAQSVITIEYGKLSIEHEKITTTTPYRIAERFIKGQAAQFDTVFTYSSIEHSGLGRYGDPLTPYGDLEASAQVWCMVKPEGHFIMAVPVSHDRQKCSLVWNAHRVYGAVRLQHLTANWRVLEEFKTIESAGNRIYGHRIFMLQRV